MDDILLVPLEKLYEITIRANMEMEIEEVFKEDLNLSLDPIRNGEIGEALNFSFFPVSSQNKTWCKNRNSVS